MFEKHIYDFKVMSPINIALVIIGTIIPIIAAIFWSIAAKLSSKKIQNETTSIIFTSSLIRWAYHHRTKFNIMIGAIVTIIEFFALLPF